MKASIILLLLLQVNWLYGETLYWKGGSGSWHDPLHWSLTSGGLSCGRIPTAADDVVFDAASFSAGNDTLFSRLPVVCRNMTWTTGAAGAKWIWNGQEGDPFLYQEILIHGSLMLAPDMALDLPGKFVFAALTTGHTITTNGNSLPVLRFIGNGGSWAFQDDLVHTPVIELVRGTLIANGHGLRADRFLSNEQGIATKAFDLTDAVLELIGEGQVWHSGYSGFTFNGSGSLIRLTNPGSSNFSGPGGPYNVEVIEPTARLVISGTLLGNVVVLGTVRFASGSTMNDLTMLPGSTFTALGPVTVNGSVSAQGDCTAPISFLSGGLIKNGDPVVIDQAILENFTASGTASFTATNSMGLGGNSGWTIEPAQAQTYYWIAGAGNWHDPQHWSLTSGGSANGCIPGPGDDVVFDANSFNASGQTVMLDKIARVKDLLFTEDVMDPILAGDQQLEIGGSMTLSSQLTYDHTGILRFNSQEAGKTITSNGCTINASTIRFQGNGGWALADQLITNGELSLVKGTFDTNDQYLLAMRVVVPDNLFEQHLILGNSLIELSGLSGWQISSSATSIQAGTSTIRSLAGSSFSGGTHTYHRLEALANSTISGGGTFAEVHFQMNGTINGGGTFGDLTFSPGHNYMFSVAAPTITGNWEAIGGCMGAIHITGPVEVQGTATLQNVSLQQLNVTGNEITATNAFDQGWNNGVIFEPWSPSELYWIGDSGDWNDPQHWSFTSGGSSSGCVPSPISNVIFDANSFTSPEEAVNITLNSKCHSMIWQAGATLTGSVVLEVYGDLVLHQEIIWEQQGPIIMRNSTSATLTSNGAEFEGMLEIHGIGTFQLLDDFNGTEQSEVLLNRGTWDANGQDIRIGRFRTQIPGLKTLQLGNSTMELTAGQEPNTMPSFTVGWSINMAPGAYTIRLTHPKAVFSGSGYSFARLVFTAPNGSVSLSAGQVSEAEFHGDAFVNAGTIGKLWLAPGHHYTGPTSTITEELIALGGCDAWIAIRGMNINVSSATVSMDHVILENVQLTGGASVVATNAVDVGGNSGFTIEQVMPKTLYWIGGDGDWNDGSHWSETSGGSSAACIPTPFDDVYFDG